MKKRTERIEADLLNRIPTPGSGVPAMKHRSWKKTAVISGSIAIALLLLVAVVPRLFDLNRYHDIIESRIEEALGGEVRLGHISWGLHKGIWLAVDGFFVRDARMLPGRADLSKVYARVLILPLLKKKIVLKRLVIEGSEVDVRIEAAPAAPSGPHEPVAFEIEQLDITIDRLALDDTLTVFGRKGTQVYWDIHVSAAPIVPGRKIAFDLSLGRSTRGNIEGMRARGTLIGLTEAFTVENPELTLSARINSLDVNVVERFFPNRRLADQLDGSVSVEMNYTGDLVEHHRIDGMIDLDRVFYKNPDLFENTLTGEGAAISYRMKLDSADLTMENLKLSLGGFSLDATAVVRLLGDEDAVVRSAEISSSGGLPDLMPYIPWPLLGDSAEAVRKMCGAGGTIDLQNVLLSEQKLSRISENPKDLLTEFRLTATFSDVSLPHLFFLPGVDRVSGRMTFEKGVFLAEDIHALIGPISLPTITVRATSIARQPKVSFRADGPLRVAATIDENMNEVLGRHGLKNFYGLTEVKLTADYDQRTSEKWVAEGVLALKGVHLEASSLDAVMDDLRGEIELSRKESFNVAVRDLTATINRTPFRLSGNLTGIGTPEMVLSAAVFSEDLDLAGVSKLVPALKAYTPEGRLDLDLDVQIPWASPAESRISGTLKTRGAGFRIPEYGVTVDGGDADITLGENAAEVVAMNLQMNGKPVALSGNLTGIGTPEMVLSAAVFSEDLDLAALSKLLPVLKAYDPGGRIDLDLDVQLPWASPAESRISGTLKTRGAGFRIHEYGVTVDGGDADITLGENAVKIDTMTLQINGQPVTLFGEVSDPGAPKMQLVLWSPGLDLDRILMPKMSSGNAELPPWAEKVTADVSATSGVIRYSGVQFQNVSLGFFYDHGMVEDYQLDFDVDGGTVKANGSADLRSSGQIPFVLEMDTDRLPAAELALLLGRDELPLKGPLSIRARLTGHTGTTGEMLAGLDGDLDVKTGEGVFKGLGPFQKVLVKLAGLTSIKGFFKGRTVDNMISEGLPFRRMEAETFFSSGTLNVEKMFFGSDALDVDGQGTVDLVNRQLAMEVELIPLTIADSALDLVPIVGDTAQSLTRVHLKITGPLDDPEVHVEQVRSVVKDVIEMPVEILKDVGEGLKKLIPGNKEEENE